MKGPTRILERALPGSIERVLLDSAGAAEPTDAQCEATWVALAARLAAAGALSAPSSSCGLGPTHIAPEAPGAGVGSTGGLSTSPAGAAGGTMGIKAAAMLGLTVLGAAVAVVAATPGRAHRVEGASSVPEAVSRAAAALPLAPSIGLEPTGSRAPALEPAAPPAAHAGLAVATPSHPLSPPASARRWLPRDPGARALLVAESSLVIAARAELRAGRCGDALERLREGSERFRGGALEQEREALRVSALGCTGSAEEASAAAAAFVESYPDSPYAATVQPHLAARSPGR
ncbi:MAG TPA: hypothetical protein VEK07_09380 [Polyangiaceae bacterium]|nr:hypothetical protein [Polyangiaceae bacterium]